MVSDKVNLILPLLDLEINQLIWIAHQVSAALIPVGYFFFFKID